MTTTESQVFTDLLTLRGLLSKEVRWCKGAFGKTPDGSPLLDPFSFRAVSWCLTGAIMKITRSDIDRYNTLRAILASTYSTKYGTDSLSDSLANVNDGSSHTDILALIDEAIDVIFFNHLTEYREISQDEPTSI